MRKSLRGSLVLVGGALIASVMLECLSAMSVPADKDNSSENYLVSEDVKGVYGSSVESFSAAQTEEDFNWDAGEILIEAQENIIQIKVPALGEDVSFDLEMYPSKMGMDNQNKMIGIEKDASYLYLFQPNSYLLGKIVVHLGIVDNNTGEIYLTQFEESRFDYDGMYSKLSNGNYTDTELTDVELSYFSM